MTSMVGGTPATAWCPNCGDTHTRGDGKCARCGSGAARATTFDAIDHANHRVPATIQQREPSTASPAPPARPAVLTMPATKGLRRWVEETKALADGLAARAAEAEARTNASAAEAARYRKAAEAFSGLLQQINLEQVAEAEPQGGRAWGRTTDGKRYSACIDCGTSETRHISHGRCMRCDARWRSARSTNGVAAS